MKTYNAAIELELESFENAVQRHFNIMVDAYLRSDAKDEALTRFNAWKVSQIAPIKITSPKAHKHTSAEPLDDPRDPFCSDS